MKKKWFALAILTLVGTLGASRAHAGEELLIKQADEHPSYVIEVEPHGVLAIGGGPFRTLGDRKEAFGFGPGIRLTFNVAKNGFLSKINDSVGIGVGADIVFVGGDVRLVIPVVMQWNFWLSTHFSAFGEPGVAFGAIGDFGVAPHLAVGGRYNFNEYFAITLRLGYPLSTFGVSLMF
ncbi:hypothetical protein BH09MYX1_BH09MYX1_32970 [soil metagenome]